jgi:ABC-type transport system involved in cytochrome c biogenesis permease subunit
MASQNLFHLAIYALSGSIVFFLLRLAGQPIISEKIGAYSAYSGLILTTIGYIFRCKDYYDAGYKYVPLTNLYDMAIFFSWVILLIVVLLDLKLHYRIIGAFLVPFALCGITWAQMMLDSSVEPWHPSLDYKLLLTHTILLSLSCAAYAIACGISTINLLQGTSNCCPDISRLSPPEIVLEDLNHKAVLSGFIIFSLSILIGSAFSRSTWGYYWSWDPKEFWEMAIWIIYAVILVIKTFKILSVKPSAWLTVAGFFSLIISYFVSQLFMRGINCH